MLRRPAVAAAYLACVPPDATTVVALQAPDGRRDLPRLSADDAAPLRQPAPSSVGPTAAHDWRVVAARLARRLHASSSARDLERRPGGASAGWSRIEVVVGLIVLAVLGAAGYVLVRNSLRPLAEVERTARAIAAGDLSRRVPEGDERTEVGRLSTALNGMLAQIETRVPRPAGVGGAGPRRRRTRMRRFVADASHELRTPLTSIRGFAELYRQGAVGAAEETRRLMQRIEAEGARMGLLVEDLLLLARLDQQRPLDARAGRPGRDRRRRRPRRPGRAARPADRAAPGRVARPTSRSSSATRAGCARWSATW